MKIDAIGSAVITPESDGQVNDAVVYQVQRALNEIAGWSRLPEDGALNRETSVVIARFQESHGLRATGTIDQRTIDCMNRELERLIDSRGAPEHHNTSNHGSGVEVCSRVASLPGNQYIGLEHWWIRTPNVEAGMGARGHGVPGHESRPDLPGIPVSVNDHRGEGARADATCVSPQVRNPEWKDVDRACVERQLRFGRDLGRWWPANQCQSFVTDVLDTCSRPRSSHGT